MSDILLPEETERRVRALAKPWARLDFIFFSSAMLRESFLEVRAAYPWLFEADAMARFIAVLFLLETTQEIEYQDLPQNPNYRRMREMLCELRKPREATDDASALPQLAFKRRQWDADLHRYFNLAWTEATAQPVHRKRFQLRLGSPKNRELAQAMCRALIALGY